MLSNKTQGPFIQTINGLFSKQDSDYLDLKKWNTILKHKNGGKGGKYGPIRVGNICQL